MAEKVLEHSPHCLLASEGAERFALSHGITPVPNLGLYFSLLNLNYSLYLGRVKNPIWLAEKVLEHSPHCLLASEGAERFALSHGITPVPNESLISPDAKKAWNHFKGSGPNYDKLSTQEGFSINETGHDTIGMTAAAGPSEPGLVAGTDYGHTKAKSQTLCGPNSNPTPK